MVSVNLKLEVDPKPSLIRKLEKLAQKLKKRRMVCTPDEIRAGAQHLLFQFDGPTGKLFRDGQFCIATAMGSCAVLLVGAASNCFGAQGQTENEISPSADPIKSLQALMRDEHETSADSFFYLWSTILKPSPKGVPFASLPITRGIGIYAGRFRYSDYETKIEEIIVGSPVFVEQT
jgi:hypothetical protein